ncbi:neural cell adhesion molecule L1-like isoform X3 [Tubulanus polymorphus]|uniref:neural cell adhesion molecule L1-like isoform X3 n=1 Tax=Tubulanus polymorphus TaxID=672921 RepID=UPI003DA25787
MSPIVRFLTLLSVAAVAVSAQNTFPVPKDDGGFPPEMYEKAEVRIPPSINSVTPSSLISSNERATLTCKANGSPKPKIRWMISSGNSEFSPVTHIPGFYEFPIKPDGTRDHTQLKVRPSRNNELAAKTPPENFKYACYAENDYGKTASNNVVVNEKYTGDFSPENLKVKPTLQVQEGLTTELKCNPPDSFPKRAIISWLIIKGYGKVDASTVRAITTDTRVMIGPNGNLFFSQILPSDATKPDSDETYVCQYNNAAQGTIKQGSPISIKVKPNPNMPNKPPALMANSPPVVSALERDQIDLYCISSAKPVATVSWRRLNGKPMPSNHSYSNGNVHLYLKNVAPSYAGEYQCTVSNSMGSKTSTSRVEIMTLPKFIKKPVDSTYIIGGTAKFECQATGNPTPTTEWLENLVPVPPKSDKKLTVNANTYELRNLIRGGEGSVNTPDMRVVQCRAKNIHGSIIANGFINVVLPLVMREPKPSDGKNASVMTFKFKETVILPCKTQSDPATIPQIEWLFNDGKIKYVENQIWQDNSDNSLHINSWKYNKEEDLRGDYTCIARTITPVQVVRGTYTLAFEGVAAVVATGGTSFWWVAIVIALILLLIIIFLIICLIRRNRGETYLVDENERKQGNDPEKEMKDAGFHDYVRPNQDPIKGSRASLNSDIKMDSDDDNDSMAEYGDIDTGKFNEDGSFIGQYGKDRKGAPPPYSANDSNVV